MGFGISESEKNRYLNKEIHIISMDGEPDYAGRVGTCTSVDDCGQLHGTWGGLALNADVDSFRVIG